MERPPHFEHRERWWRWMALVRGLMGVMEEGRLMWWGWVEWVEALEEGRKEKFGAKVIRCSCGAKLEGFRRMRSDGLCKSCEVKGVCGNG